MVQRLRRVRQLRSPRAVQNRTEVFRARREKNRIPAEKKCEDVTLEKENDRERDHHSFNPPPPPLASWSGSAKLARDAARP